MTVDLYIIGEPHIMSQRWEFFAKLIETNGPNGTKCDMDVDPPPEGNANDIIIEIEDDELRIWDDEDIWLQVEPPAFRLRLSHPDMIKELQSVLSLIDNHLGWKDFFNTYQQATSTIPWSDPDFDENSDASSPKSSM